MIQEEFSRLIDLYQQAAEGKGGSIDELFQKSLEFIEHLKKQIATGDEEDRQAGFRMMQELYDCMQAQAKTVAKSMGLNDEQLKANLENPANFTPEQWNKMQESNRRLSKAGEGLLEALQPKDPSAPAASPSPPPDKKGPKVKKAKKSNWMRS
jgi:hypothetical protein